MLMGPAGHPESHAVAADRCLGLTAEQASSALCPGYAVPLRSSVLGAEGRARRPWLWLSLCAGTLGAQTPGHPWGSPATGLRIPLCSPCVPKPGQLGKPGDS